MDEALIQEQERQLQKTGRYYKHVFWLCVPLLCMACYFYGARPLLLCGIALLTGNLCDRLVALLRHRVYPSSVARRWLSWVRTARVSLPW